MLPANSFHSTNLGATFINLPRALLVRLVGGERFLDEPKERLPERLHFNRPNCSFKQTSNANMKTCKRVYPKKSEEMT